MHTLIEKDWFDGEYRAIVVMTSTGWRCGYVGIPKEHKAFGIDYYTFDAPLENQVIQAVNNIEVHGGLTYANNGVANINDGRWYFGYDCAHYNDTLEKCTLEYCINECENLIEQLKDIK